MNQENIYFDVRKFERTEFGLLVIENRIADLEKRVDKYQAFKVDRLGNPDFPFTKNKETDRRELNAIFLAQEMAQRGYTNFLWISGPGGDYDYPDTRITWLKVANVSEDNVYFDNNLAICSEIGGERCVELAKSLVNHGGDILGDPKNVDELRSFVVGFKDGQIIERLAVCLDEMDKVWMGIQNGVVEKNFAEADEVAAWVESNYGSRMKKSLSDLEAIRLGAIIEVQIRQRFGVNLMAGGVHGMSNQNALSRLSVAVPSIFDRVFMGGGILPSNENLDSRLQRCEKHQACFIKNKGKCPKCEKDGK